MAEIKDLNVVDNSNTARFPEAMLPSVVNNSARALEAMLARGLQDTIDGILITAGTGSAYTATANRSFTASATMYNGAEMFLRFHAACADTPTLNVSTTDARKIFWPDGTTLSASDILANTQGRVKYNTSLSAWVLMDAPVPQKNNLGHIINSRSLTATVTGTAFVPVLSKATGEMHKMTKATLAPAVSTPGLVFISAQNPSAVAAVDFTTGISSTYETYLLVGHLIPATDDVQLWLRLDSAGGASFDAGASDYVYALAGRNSAAGVEANQSSGDTKIQISPDSGAGRGTGNGASEGVSFRIQIHAPSNAARKTQIIYDCGHHAADNTQNNGVGTGRRDNAQADDAVRLLFESGDIASGHVALYGLRKS